MDLFHSIQERIDFRMEARIEFETRVASKDTVLDVGGRNNQSRSNQRLRQLSSNPKTRIVSTDVIEDYGPDIVDDICDSKIDSNSFDAIYCDAILEHVGDYSAAIRHIHRILKPGGELFVYVPFFWCFHDQMDYHRFTFTEVDRMLQPFSERKLFLPDGNGYGGVVWQVCSFYRLAKFPGALHWLSRLTNGMLAIPLWLLYLLGRESGPTGTKVSWPDYRFYFTHLYMNHGFCGWAKK